jgi:hypothetical protein
MQAILDRLDQMQLDSTTRHQAMNDRLDQMQLAMNDRFAAADASINELRTSVAKVGLFTSF